MPERDVQCPKCGKTDKYMIPANSKGERIACSCGATFRSVQPDKLPVTSIDQSTSAVPLVTKEPGKGRKPWLAPPLLCAAFLLLFIFNPMLVLTAWEITYGTWWNDYLGTMFITITLSVPVRYIFTKMRNLPSDATRKQILAGYAGFAAIIVLTTLTIIAHIQGRAQMDRMKEDQRKQMESDRRHRQWDWR